MLKRNLGSFLKCRRILQLAVLGSLAGEPAGKEKEEERSDVFTQGVLHLWNPLPQDAATPSGLEALIRGLDRTEEDDPIQVEESSTGEEPSRKRLCDGGAQPCLRKAMAPITRSGLSPSTERSFLK